MVSTKQSKIRSEVIGPRNHPKTVKNVYYENLAQFIPIVHCHNLNVYTLFISLVKPLSLFIKDICQVTNGTPPESLCSKDNFTEFRFDKSGRCLSVIWLEPFREL